MPHTWAGALYVPPTSFSGRVAGRVRMGWGTRAHGFGGRSGVHAAPSLIDVKRPRWSRQVFDAVVDVYEPNSVPDAFAELSAVLLSEIGAGVFASALVFAGASAISQPPK